MNQKEGKKRKKRKENMEEIDIAADRKWLTIIGDLKIEINLLTIKGWYWNQLK